MVPGALTFSVVLPSGRFMHLTLPLCVSDILGMEGLLNCVRTPRFHLGANSTTMISDVRIVSICIASGTD